MARALCFLLGAFVGGAVGFNVTVCFACIAVNGRRAEMYEKKRGGE